MTDLIKRLQKLPVFVTYKKIEFQLSIIFNGEDDTRLVYAFYNENDAEIWNHKLGVFYNQFVDSNCDFLYLIANIESECEMHEAIDELLRFLEENKEQVIQ